MARIPDIQYASELPYVQRGPSGSATADMFRTVANVTQEASDAVYKFRAREAETLMAKEFSEYQSYMLDQYQQLSIERQADPTGFTDTFLERADNEFQARLKRGQDPIFRDSMTARYQAYRNTLKGQAIDFEARQRETIFRARFDESLANNMATVYKDPAQADIILNQLQGDMAAGQALAVIPDAPARLAAAAQEIRRAQVDGLVAKQDYQGARTIAESGQLGDATPRVLQEIEKVEKEQASLMRRDAIRFASQDEADQILQDAANNGDEATLRAYEQRMKALQEDPAGYVEQAPEVMAARQRYETATDAAQKNVYLQEYRQQVIEAQRRMGLDDFDTLAVPARESKRVSDLLVNPRASIDETLQQLDGYYGAFPNMQREAVFALRQQGLKGPLATVAMMPMEADRASLVRAVRMGKDKLTAGIPTTEQTALRQSVTDSADLRDFHATLVPSLREQIGSDYYEGVELLAYEYMQSRGLNSSEAVKEATKQVLKGHRVVGKTLFPDSVPEDIAEDFVRNRREILGQFDIYVTPSLPDAEQVRNVIKRDAIPRRVGDYIMFEDPMGQPILDASKVVLDEFGAPTQESLTAAKIRIPISDLMLYTSKINTQKRQQRVQQARPATSKRFEE